MAELNAHALLIQLVAYRLHPLPEVDDAADLAAVLRDPARCGYPAAQVRLLTDQQATREAVLAAVRALVASADADATVLLYFSGHGGRVGDESYLLPIDVEFSRLPASAISARELAAALAPLTARKVLLIFDCCHAGGLEAKDLLPFEPGLSDDAHDALLRGHGWALLASSGPDERSYVRTGERNGVFTKHLLAALRGATPSEDGYVRIFELFEYVQPRVTQEMPAQRPVFKCEVRDNFAVARYRGGAAGQVARTDDGFRYDVLLSYAQADAGWVSQRLVPRLRAANLRVATTNDVVELGVDRVVGLERGLAQARRTVVIVSAAFLRREHKDDRYSDYAVLRRKHADIEGGIFSLIPLYLQDPSTLSDSLGWLTSLSGIRLDVAAGLYVDEEGELMRLLQALARPRPHW